MQFHTTVQAGFVAGRRGNRQSRVPFPPIPVPLPGGGTQDASSTVCTPPRARVCRGKTILPPGCTGSAAIILNRDRL